MEKLTEHDYKELSAICEEITVLKLKRIERFGKDWQLKINRHGRKRRMKSQRDPLILSAHLRKMDEVMALKNYTKGQLLGRIGLSRNTYLDIKNGFCSNRVNAILTNINWEKL